jgi:uncharacterized protein YukE
VAKLIHDAGSTGDMASALQNTQQDLASVRQKANGLKESLGLIWSGGAAQKYDGVIDAWLQSLTQVDSGLQQMHASMVKFGALSADAEQQRGQMIPTEPGTLGAMTPAVPATRSSWT